MNPDLDPTAVVQSGMPEQHRILVRVSSDASQSAAEDFLGRSLIIDNLRTLVTRVAGADSAVLIEGETGTGKERIARAIHGGSRRRDGPFVAVSCGGLSETSLDSVLFGGEAPGACRGVLLEADGGTLFLDEVGDMSPHLQAKLVRVMETGDLRAVGISRQVDVRWVALTHEHLWSLVNGGKFRADLFFRLNVVPVRVPALREHPEDIALLAEAFLTRLSGEQSFAGMFTPGAMELLETYDWPGNVRELENLIECLSVTKAPPPFDVDAVHAVLTQGTQADPVPSLVASHLSLDALEERYIAGVLRHTKGNKAMAAEILGIDLSTLYRRGKKRTP